MVGTLITKPALRRFLLKNLHMNFGADCESCPIAKAFNVVVFADGTYAKRVTDTTHIVLPQWAQAFVYKYDDHIHRTYTPREFSQGRNMLVSGATALNILTALET